MNQSRDIALIIIFAVLTFIFQALIGQVPRLITGIPGIGYAFTIFHSITQTVSWLMFEGRRWRMFGTGLLFSLLALSLVQTFTIPIAMASILNSFLVDLIFNSFYGSFERRNKALLWVVLAQLYFWGTLSLYDILFFSVFAPIDEIIRNWFIPVMSIMLPVIIIEILVGSYIGYHIYKRVEHIS